jgi:glycerol uptake facilitator protein
MGVRTHSILARCLAEALGTFLLVFFGCGAVHVAVLTGALSGLWQVAVVWAVAIMLAIYVVGALSGAHINPAITLAFAVWGRFRWGDVFFYVLGQFAGAFVAAAVLFLLYGPFLAAKEKEKHVVRGQPGSEITAMCYGEYFPNPDRLGGGVGPYSPEEHERHNVLVTEPAACAAELLGTLLLALLVFAVTDERNVVAPAARLAPVFIGLAVAVLIVVIAPLTQACFNPARDFGPRLFAALAGWGRVALPGRGSGFLTVYILAPIFGAVAGGGLYNLVLQPCLPQTVEERAVP